MMKRVVNRSTIGTLTRSATTAEPSLSSPLSAAAFPNKNLELFKTQNPPKKPKTVQWGHDISNYASFIGTVTRPVQRFDTSNSYGATTSLHVKVIDNPNRSFRIYLKMWDEMADISLAHIKQNDFLHITGRVESYTTTRTDENNVAQIFYEVNVKEINFVAKCEHSPTSKKTEQLDSGGESAFERSRARFRLWQLLFTNPSEWLDFRTKKVNPKHPDFKHKDTGEALWICYHDPPWVKTQLQLLDSKSKKQDNIENSTSSFSSFI